jgi:hypothetical protein
VSQNHVTYALAALALALAAAGPAAAGPRSAQFQWAAASGPVAGYAVYVSIDGGAPAVYAYVGAPSAVIQVTSGASLSVSTAAYDAQGRMGPRSAASAPIRLCPGDFDGDQMIGLFDVGQSQACLNQVATGSCSAGDLTGDGLVNFYDFRAMQVGTPACADDDGMPCPGDFDGDGTYTSTEYFRVRACLGLNASGGCELADFDGNGFIGNMDVLLASRSVGADTCNL